MTAFDNIKVNNWPATSNDLEDFLFLKMPLNDLDSLTESSPVVAGSRELYPKLTLANRMVRAQGAGDVLYSSGLSGTNGLSNPGKNAFDGSLTTYAQTNLSSDNSINVDFSSDPISYSSSVRIYCYAANGYDITNTYYLNSSSSGTTFTGGDSNFNGAAWITVASGSGTLNHLRLRLERGGGNSSAAGLYAIEVDGTILTEPAGGLKKHYDNNAIFNGSSSQIYHAPDRRFNLGTDDFCIECWFKKDNLTATGQLFQLGLEVYYTNNIEISVGTNGQARFFGYGNGTDADGGESSNNVVTSGTWHHMACTRQGTTFRGFIDGTQHVTWTKAASWNVGSSTESHNSPTIGARTNGSRNAMHNWFGGSIQDFRLYKGIAKYTANFTPPSAILG